MILVILIYFRWVLQFTSHFIIISFIFFFYLTNISKLNENNTKYKYIPIFEDSKENGDKVYLSLIKLRWVLSISIFLTLLKLNILSIF